MAEKVSELRVRWPSGEEFVLRDVQTNQLITVGFNPAEAIQLQSVYPIYLPLVGHGQP